MASTKKIWIEFLIGRLIDLGKVLLSIIVLILALVALISGVLGLIGLFAIACKSAPQIMALIGTWFLWVVIVVGGFLVTGLTIGWLVSGWNTAVLKVRKRELKHLDNIKSKLKELE